jgi:glutathione S-transferase
MVVLELGAPCQLEETKFPPSEVEAFNPAIQVPTLIDGCRVVFGTRLIAEYLMAEYAAA